MNGREESWTGMLRKTNRKPRKHTSAETKDEANFKKKDKTGTAQCCKAGGGQE